MGNDLKNVDNKLLNDIVKRILKVSQPEKIILFGSYARGDATLKGLSPSKDILVYTPEEVNEWKSASTSFIATVLREGRVLYERK